MKPFRPAGLEEGGDHYARIVPETIDARGLICPLPRIRARLALARLAPGGELVVLTTDPEAPLDLAALAADEGCTFARREREGWVEVRLGRPARPRSA